jgi:hypothetical protein
MLNKFPFDPPTYALDHSARKLMANPLSRRKLERLGLLVKHATDSLHLYMDTGAFTDFYVPFFKELDVKQGEWKDWEPS